MSEIPGTQGSPNIVEVLEGLREAVEKLEQTTAGLVSKEYIETYQAEEARRRRNFALLVIGTCACVLIMVGLLFVGYLRQQSLADTQQQSLGCQAQYNEAFRQNSIEARKWAKEDRDALAQMIQEVVDSTTPQGGAEAIRHWLRATAKTQQKRQANPPPEIPEACSP